MTNVEGAEGGDSVFDLQVTKRSKKQWVLNPSGKSPVSNTELYKQIKIG